MFSSGEGRPSFIRPDFRVRVFNATFNNISVISWQSVLLVEETRVPRENHRPVTNHRQTLSHIMLFRVHLAMSGIQLITLLVIGTDCTDSCKSNYHTITISTFPARFQMHWDSKIPVNCPPQERSPFHCWRSDHISGVLVYV